MSNPVRFKQGICEHCNGVVPLNKCKRIPREVEEDYERGAYGDEIFYSAIEHETFDDGWVTCSGSGYSPKKLI